MPETEVGILACSGEECLGGTISRLATRKVMAYMRPNKAVTLCLPLYIAGGEEERNFANEYPVIAVEGCRKCCSTRATEKFSGKVHDTVLVPDILGDDVCGSEIISLRDLTDEHHKMIHKVAQQICERLDAIQNE